MVRFIKVLMRMEVRLKHFSRHPLEGDLGQPYETILQ